MPGSWIVPFEWSDLICTCQTSDKSVDDQAYFMKHGHVCAKCKKMFRYQLRTCKDCRDVFIVSEFQSRFVCYKYPRCLTCISLVQTPCEHDRCRQYMDHYEDLKILNHYEKKVLGDIDDMLDDMLNFEDVNPFD